MPNQASAPGTPTSALRLYADASNRIAWKHATGFAAIIDTSGFTADRTVTIPNASGTLVTQAATQTLTNKTLTSPVISGGTIDNAVIGGTTAAAITGTAGRFNSDLTLAGAPGKIKPAANSTTALQVAQADGTAFITFDTTNKRLGINTAAPSDDLHLGTGAIRFTGTYAPSGDLRIVESAGAITIEASSVSSKFRLLPFGSDVYFQNTLSTGGMQFSGPSAGNLDGNYIFRMAASSRMGLSTTGPGAKLHLVDRLEGSSASAINAFILERTETGTPLAGFGQTMVFRFKSSTTDSRDAAYVRGLWNDPTNAAAIGDLVLIAAHNAAGTVTEREGLRIRGGASATQIGFFGTTPAARQTGYTTFANLTTDRTLDANATTIDEVADVLGTLIADLKTLGLISA